MLKASIIEGLKNGKGKSITCIDLRSISSAVADYFIICHGDSSTQVEGLKKPWHEEGVSNAEWILMDYVNIVVHIFHRETRSIYNLEQLWADAPVEEFENV